MACQNGSAPNWVQWGVSLVSGVLGIAKIDRVWPVSPQIRFSRSDIARLTNLFYYSALLRFPLP